MKNLKKIVGLVITLMISVHLNAQDNPLAKYLEVPGATTTLPVSEAKKPFSLEFAQDAQAKFGNFHYQLGGDHALYYNLHLSEVLHTATSKPNEKLCAVRESPLTKNLEMK